MKARPILDAAIDAVTWPDEVLGGRRLRLGYGLLLAGLLSIGIWAMLADIASTLLLGRGLLGE